MPTITAIDFERWRTEGCLLDPPDECFVRGAMVILHGLVSKPELNGRHCLARGRPSRIRPGTCGDSARADDRAAHSDLGEACELCAAA